MGLQHTLSYFVLLGHFQLLTVLPHYSVYAEEDLSSITLHIVCMHSADTGSMSWIADKGARPHAYGWQLWSYFGWKLWHNLYSALLRFVQRYMACHIHSICMLTLLSLSQDAMVHWLWPVLGYITAWPHICAVNGIPPLCKICRICVQLNASIYSIKVWVGRYT